MPLVVESVRSLGIRNDPLRPPATKPPTSSGGEQPTGRRGHMQGRMFPNGTVRSCSQPIPSLAGQDQGVVFRANTLAHMSLPLAPTHHPAR